MLKKDILITYRNYLATLQYHQEYGDKYGDTQELIEMYERKLNMKEPYRWNYTIRIKTKEGTFEYEEDDVLEAVKLVEQHPNYEEFYLQHKNNAPRLTKTPRIQRLNKK